MREPDCEPECDRDASLNGPLVARLWCAPCGFGAACRHSKGNGKALERWEAVVLVDHQMGSRHKAARSLWGLWCGEIELRGWCCVRRFCQVPR